MLLSKENTIGDRLLSIETGKLAVEADQSVTVRYGDTIVLVTLCVGEERPDGRDFLRLTVDYEERHYAVGKIPGSFIRREGRPSEQATLTARLTDRSLRPLLSKSLTNEIQIVITVLSTDQENLPDMLALIGASACLNMSFLPFKGPVGGVRVGYIDGSLVLNPTLTQLNDSPINVIVVGTKEAVVMIEAEGDQTNEELILDAIKFGQESNRAVIQLQEDLQQVCNQPKMEVKENEINPELLSAVSSEFGERLAQAIPKKRDERENAIKSIKNEIVEKLCDTYSEIEIGEVTDGLLKKAARKHILNNRMHLDGRQYDEIRPLSSDVGILPRTHGSGLFSRGLTQVLTITTLGSSRQEQLIDGLGVEDTKRFMHHYNFPPFSTGEVKRMGSPGRREIGHGALAERALSPIIPGGNDFAYTIRLVSEVLSSNGSTSMASVCASTLSLMDAGVPIKAPVAGIAMGLVTGNDDNYVVLTDIEGLEDAYGDMDFKVAGTSEGITAIQLDTKLTGISHQIIIDTLYQAREARLKILENMRTAIALSRPELSSFAPRMYRIKIDQNKIGAVIGPGGKTIRSIVEETGASVDVENDGTVIIGSPNEESARKAIGIIEDLTREVEVGAIYTGKVTRITNFGAFVEVLRGKEGLVHISELADYRVDKVEDIVKEGDEITVKVTEIDSMGRVNLSRRAVFGGTDQTHRSDSATTGGDHRPQSRSRSGMHQQNSRDSRYRHNK